MKKKRHQPGRDSVLAYANRIQASALETASRLNSRGQRPIRHEGDLLDMRVQVRTPLYRATLGVAGILGICVSYALIVINASDDLTSGQAIGLLGMFFGFLLMLAGLRGKQMSVGYALSKVSDATADRVLADLVEKLNLH